MSALDRTKIPAGWVHVTSGTTCARDQVWNADENRFEAVDSVNEYVDIYHAVIREGSAVQVLKSSKRVVQRSGRQIETLATSYVHARDGVRKAKLERSRHRCTEFSSGSVSMPGDDVPECWRDGGDSSEWCEECQKAQVHHLAAKKAQKEVQRIWRKLKAEVLRTSGRRLP